jgi:RNA polymerase sigma-70 factor (ECF subfamily)
VSQPPGDFSITLDLLRRAQGGERAALQPLLERYYERVRRIVRLRLGTALRRRLDSGDILQETFLAAIRNFARFELRDEASFINWLAVLAENQIRDAADYHGAQKRAIDRQVPLEFTDRSGPIGLDPVASDLLPPGAASRAEEIARIESAIERLPPEHRELILLRDYAGASWDVIAEHTGRPSPDAARMMHAKAMVQLARLARGD